VWAGSLDKLDKYALDLIEADFIAATVVIRDF